jgi:hypothetical protein
MSFRNALKSQSLLLLFVALLSLCFVEGCGGGGGGSGSTSDGGGGSGGGTASLTLQDIVGTYELVEFEVIYEGDPHVYTQNDFDSFSGTLIIYPESTAYQEITIEGFTYSELNSFTIVSGNRILVDYDGCTYYADVAYNPPYLTTFIPMGGDCDFGNSEEVKWRKISSQTVSNTTALGQSHEVGNKIFKIQLP